MGEVPLYFREQWPSLPAWHIQNQAVYPSLPPSLSPTLPPSLPPSLTHSLTPYLPHSLTPSLPLSLPSSLLPYPTFANCRGASPIRKRPPPQAPPRTLGIGLQ